MPKALAATGAPHDAIDREGSIPNLAALRAFVVAAQHRSFSRTAEELGITQSGVSRAIRSIEVSSGAKLFERTGHGLVLTEAGHAFNDEVSALLLELQASTLRLATYSAHAESLHIATLPSLGGRWLAPRLSKFLQRNPNINLTVTAQHGHIDFDGGGFDAAICYGSEAWPGTMSEFLMDEYLVPMCSPVFIENGVPPSPRLLRNMVLIQHTHRPTAWREWFRACGLDHAAPHVGPRFEQYEMGIEAAKTGLGAILMPPFMVSDELARQALVPLHDAPVLSQWRYHLVYPKSKRTKPTVQKFRAWLRREARQTSEQLGPKA
jgi:DNA-binding transcriptional LysR family regulator